MAKVNFNKAKLTRKLEESIKTIPYDRIGRTVVKRIKDQTRSGISIVDEKPFKKLKESTIENKKRLAKYNKTSKFYSEFKSNLTLFGEMLNALTFNRFDNVGLTTLKIFVRPTSRKPIKTSRDGRKRRPKIDNAKLAEIHNSGTGNIPRRSFLGIDNEGFEQVTRIISSHLRRELRKLNR